MLDPVLILEQRRSFLGVVTEIAQTCNWSDRDTRELYECLWDTLVQIDNLMIGTYEETGNMALARAVWEASMEDLRQWLGRIFGLKVRYI